MYDIITFGSAARDINIKSKAFKILKNLPAVAGGKDFVTGEGMCLASGSKIDIDEIFFSFGGGGANTAVTFAKQGFKTAFCGAVGDDMYGKEIIAVLKALKIDTGFVVKKKERATNYSIIISAGQGDRTILAYRGASDLLNWDDVPWKKVKAKWFYLAPMAGLLCDTFSRLVNFAKENNIKVAANPSKQQLSLAPEQLINIFSKIDILFLNQEEASYLTKIPYQNESDIFKKIDEMCPGVVVMTKGGEGVVVSDGKYMYSAKPSPLRKIADTTGAGDSFASGFLSDYIRYEGDIEKAIQLGMANSQSCLSVSGAQNGLLDKNAIFDRVQVLKQKIQ